MYRLYDFNFCFIEECETFKVKNFSGIAENTASKSKYWITNGIVHRNESLGHAIEHKDGKKIWLTDGMYHRINGPAIESPNGKKMWFLYDVEYTKAQHKLYVDLLRLKGLLTKHEDKFYETRR